MTTKKTAKKLFKITQRLLLNQRLVCLFGFSKQIYSKMPTKKIELKCWSVVNQLIIWKWSHPVFICSPNHHQYQTCINASLSIYDFDSAGKLFCVVRIFVFVVTVIFRTPLLSKYNIQAIHQHFNNSTSSNHIMCSLILSHLVMLTYSIVPAIQYFQMFCHLREFHFFQMREIERTNVGTHLIPQSIFRSGSFRWKLSHFGLIIQF